MKNALKNAFFFCALSVRIALPTRVWGIVIPNKFADLCYKAKLALPKTANNFKEKSIKL
jgi:hypothetical protein